MKLTKRVDFENLLSSVASMEKIAQALDDGYREELNKIRTTMNKAASDRNKDDSASAIATGVANAMTAGSVAGGAMAYHNKLRTDKAVRKLDKYDNAKQGNNASSAYSKKIKKIKKTARKTVRRIGDALTQRDRKREKLLENVAKSRQRTAGAGKIGLGLAAGAAGLNIYNNIRSNRGSYEKTASSESIREQLAREVERESTPEGGAAYRGTQGAIIGGLAGVLHGITKKGGIKGRKAKLIRGAWHGTAGAVWGGGSAGGVTYLKKKLFPDTEEDKQRAFEKKLEKRAFDNIGYIGSLNLSDAVQGEKEAAAGMPMDFTTKTLSRSAGHTGTIFNKGTKGAIAIGSSSAKRVHKTKHLSMSEAMAGKGRADAAAVREKAFVKGNGKGGVFGGLRAITSALTSPTSTVGKFLRRKI